MELFSGLIIGIVIGVLATLVAFLWIALRAADEEDVEKPERWSRLKAANYPPSQPDLCC